MVEPGLPDRSNEARLMALRKHMSDQLMLYDNPSTRMPNCDVVDLMRDTARKCGLHMRVVRGPGMEDKTAITLHIFAYDPRTEIPRCQPPKDKTDAFNNPQWIGEFQRIQGVEGIQGSKPLGIK